MINIKKNWVGWNLTSEFLSMYAYDESCFGIPYNEISDAAITLDEVQNIKIRSIFVFHIKRDSESLMPKLDSDGKLVIFGTLVKHYTQFKELWEANRALNDAPVYISFVNAPGNLPAGYQKFVLGNVLSQLQDEKFWQNSNIQDAKVLDNAML